MTTKGVGDHNYCRNLDGVGGVWCYTVDAQVVWEYCYVPYCDKANAPVIFAGGQLPYDAGQGGGGGKHVANIASEI